ncbi:helix-turn-helix domain-containing protein [Finegoldia magna]|uniref:helix-turn-helix domain-containing protein n=1 Tax=Finegoldia magna TaxID=1260 RepID=UPI00399AF53E
MKKKTMASDHSKLWELLDEKKMYKEDLRLDTGMSLATLAKLGKNEIVSMDVFARICESLKCDVGDIASYVEDK